MKPFFPSVRHRLGLSLASLGLLAATASAQVTFVRNGDNNVSLLRQINTDGTGDAGFNLPFSTVAFPSWTRDGGTVVFNAVDPAAGSQRGTNVFAFSPGTGALAQLTNYVDQLDPTRGSQAFSYTMPYYKAFSPDNTAMAVFSDVVTGGPNSSHDGGGVRELPTLEIFSLTTVANPVLVLVDTEKNGRHHGGEGVDWSPTQNVLAAPLETNANFQSGGGPGEVTAIFLVNPVAAAKQTGQLRQITFPHTDANLNTGQFVSEHDYMPKFSPDGGSLAYVRSFQSHALTSSLNPNPDVQSLRILNLSTGAEAQVGQFPQGVYISSLAWSPNGTALVFDLGLQPNSVVGPLQQADPSTNQVYLANTDGSNLHQLLGNGNSYPSWRPTVTGSGLGGTGAGGGGTGTGGGTGGGGAGGGTGTGTVPTVVNVGADTNSVSRSAGQKATVTLTRPAGSDLSKAVKVNVKATGNLVPGADFKALKAFVKIKAGQTNGTLKIVPLAGGGTGKITIKLLPGDGYSVGDAAKLKVKITD